MPWLLFALTLTDCASHTLQDGGRALGRAEDRSLGSMGADVWGKIVMRIMGDRASDVKDVAAHAQNPHQVCPSTSGVLQPTLTFERCS